MTHEHQPPLKLLIIFDEESSTPCPCADKTINMGSKSETDHPASSPGDDA